MNPKQIESMINNFKVTKSKTVKNGKYKVVAVTSCPVGIAHTFMAAEALEKEALKRGVEIKVEKQAAIGTKDELSQKEIDEADFVIFAVGKEVEGIERFAGKKLIDVAVHKGIKEAKKIFDDLEKGNVEIMPSRVKSKNGAKNEISTKRKQGG
jgi:fructose-specific phosphotransferase system IIB component